MIVKLRISKYQFEKLLHEGGWVGDLYLGVPTFHEEEIGIKDVIQDYVSSTGDKKLYSRARVILGRLDKILPAWLLEKKKRVRVADWEEQKLEVISVESEPRRTTL